MNENNENKLADDIQEEPVTGLDDEEKLQLIMEEMFRRGILFKKGEQDE